MLASAALALACSRDPKPPPPRDAAADAPAAATTAARPPGFAEDAGLGGPRSSGRAGPRVPAGLRLLTVRGGDGGATLTGAGDPATLLPGDRVKPGDPVRVPDGMTGVFRSADLGLELEVKGPARFRVDEEESVLLANGEVAIAAAPRAPGAIASPHLQADAVPGLRVRATPKETVVLPAERTPTTVFRGDPWAGALEKATVTVTDPKASVAAAIARCQKEAAGARAAWERTIGGGAPAGPPGGGDAYAAHAEARRRARAACNVARAAAFAARTTDLAPDGGTAKEAAETAQLTAAEALWRELPGRVDAGIARPASSSR